MLHKLLRTCSNHHTKKRIVQFCRGKTVRPDKLLPGISLKGKMISLCIMDAHHSLSSSPVLTGNLKKHVYFWIIIIVSLVISRHYNSSLRDIFSIHDRSLQARSETLPNYQKSPEQVLSRKLFLNLVLCAVYGLWADYILLKKYCTNIPHCLKD